MKFNSNLCPAFALAGLALTAFAAHAADSDFHRGRRLEMGLQGSYQSGDITVFPGVGSVKFDPAYGAGVHINCNFTDHISLGMDLGLGVSPTTMDAGGTTFKTDTTTGTGFVNVEYNLLKSRFTPFLTASAGFNTFTGDIDGISYSEASFAYGGGGGLRWDFNDHWYAKLTYRYSRTELQDSANAMNFHSVMLGVGFRF